MRDLRMNLSDGELALVQQVADEQGLELEQAVQVLVREGLRGRVYGATGEAPIGQVVQFQAAGPGGGRDE